MSHARTSPELLSEGGKAMHCNSALAALLYPASPVAGRLVQQRSKTPRHVTTDRGGQLLYHPIPAACP